MEIDSNKPIWQMTAGEFVELMTSTLKENEKFAVRELPKFLTVPELAKLTGYSVSTVNIKNSKREIPGSRKLNGRVLFDTDTILEWIDLDSIDRPTRLAQLELLENNFSKRMSKRNN